MTPSGSYQTKTKQIDIIGWHNSHYFRAEASEINQLMINITLI